MTKRSSVKKGGKNNDSFWVGWNNMLSYVHNNITTMNSSKLFAGVVVITLNIASRFVNLKLSKSMESFLKYTFSRDALVFCMVWMGSRDIYIALSVMLVFILFMDFLFNENSRFCILPENFTDYHINLLNTNNGNPPTDDEVKNANAILERICNNVGSDEDKELCSNIMTETKYLFSNYTFKKSVGTGIANNGLPQVGGGSNQGNGDNDQKDGATGQNDQKDDQNEHQMEEQGQMSGVVSSQ
jgi:hypothetical protein